MHGFSIHSFCLPKLMHIDTYDLSTYGSYQPTYGLRRLVHTCMCWLPEGRTAPDCHGLHNLGAWRLILIHSSIQARAHAPLRTDLGAGVRLRGKEVNVGDGDVACQCV
eukprot:1159014-Pelagomonas_calceolata.AAC.15